MSRIGQMPITVPSGVQVSRDNGVLTVKGPKGTLTREIHPSINVRLEDDKIVCERPSDAKPHRALHGLTRTLINNMIVGVTQGYEKKLQIIGVGYRAEMQGQDLVLQVGYSHPVRYTPPQGITLTVEQGNRIIHVDGIDKELVGEVAAQIRAVRKPEPYKGKGIRYLGEYVRQKAGKAGKASK